MSTRCQGFSERFSTVLRQFLGCGAAKRRPPAAEKGCKNDPTSRSRSAPGDWRFTGLPLARCRSGERWW